MSESFVVKEFSTMHFRNRTYSTNPEADMANLIQVISVRRNYAVGPSFSFGETSWLDGNLIETWYVAWHSYASIGNCTVGYFYTGGSHRVTFIDPVEVLEAPGSPSYFGIWVPPCWG
ncbi:MAG TPA: hypothetical protein VFO94_21075 [Gammaproteobacteria bacterium]|nr:hypothetical protein [Gammaproteobacteria bacterium]